MADKKISSLSELTAVATDDELVIVDKSDTTMAATGTTKKIIMETILEAIYPVGSIFVSGSDTMPALIDGLGTWERIEGKFIVGASDTDGDFDNGDTGGEKTHTLTEAELASHNHTVNPPATNTSNDTHSHDIGDSNTRSLTVSSPNLAWTGGSNYRLTGQYDTDSDTHNHSVDIAEFDSGDTGSGDAHNNLPPYKAKYMWERTA